VVNALIWAGIRQQKGALVGVFVAVLAATMLATGLGVLLESGSRGGVAPQRYTAAAVIVGGKQTFETPEKATYALPERAPLSADARDAIRQLPGTAGIVADATVPMAWGASTIEAHGWSAAALTPYRISEGHAPRGDDEVVVGADLAARTELGTSIRLAHGGIDRAYRVVGIAESTTGEQPTRAAHVFLTDEAASALAPRGQGGNVIGVFARQGVAPDDPAEVPAEADLLQQRGHETLRLVGHHRQFDSGGAQGFQQLVHARVERRQLMAVGVDIEKAGQRRFGFSLAHPGMLDGAGQRAAHQHPRAIADPLAHLLDTGARPPQFLQHAVHGGRQIRHRVDQRAVQVEHHQARQVSGAELAQRFHSRTRASSARMASITAL